MSGWNSGFCERIERSLAGALAASLGVSGPPRVAAAIEDAVFPGGARIRPALCLAVARACGDRHPAMADAAAAALELLHCASLVHDDLECFDNASLRRGKPAVHKAYGEALAVLAGDGLIVAAFRCVSEAGCRCPHLLAPILLHLCRAIDSVDGLIAGQALELEPAVDIERYHRAKTGALFEAAAMCGALAGGGEAQPWRALGAKLGVAFQMADDIADVAADASAVGKPIHRDIALGRPNASRFLAPAGAFARLRELLMDAFDSIPAGADPNLGTWLAGTVDALLRRRLNWSFKDNPLNRTATSDPANELLLAGVVGCDT